MMEETAFNAKQIQFTTIFPKFLLHPFIQSARPEHCFYTNSMRFVSPSFWYSQKRHEHEIQWVAGDEMRFTLIQEIKD